jgi:hypothetical protein
VEGLRKPLDVLKSELGRASTYARAFTDAAASRQLTRSSKYQQLEEAGQALYSFNFSDFLRREYRFGLDPNRPSCKAYLQGHCPLGSRCPDKHHVSSSYNK